MPRGLGEKNMATNLQNAISLYERGIRDGEVQEVLDNYMGPTYAQHSTGVRDGKEGFAEFFGDFLKRNPKRDIRVVRSFADGDYVFLHVYQSLNDGAARWVTTDVFRSDREGRIVEHWDVIEEYREPALGMPDQVLGAFEVHDRDQTERNKAVVRRFLVEAMQNHEAGALGRHVAEGVVQHDPAIGQGRDAWADYLRRHDVAYDFVFKVLGSGDHVAAYSQVLADGTAYALFDLFRLEDGAIVEHWDNKEVVPSRMELANSGKF